jgi:hypothetical protein
MLLWLIGTGSSLAKGRVALVIGNSAYAHVPVLANPGRDAQTIAATLKSIGFDDVMVETDLDYGAMRRALGQFAKLAAGAEIALVYYAGHGIEVGGQNYLVPTDAELSHADLVEFESMPLSTVMAALSRANRLKLIILDACRDNPFAARMTREGATRSVGRGLARVEPDGGDTLVAYAAREGTVAIDGDGTNSPYATALARHLSEPGLDIRFLFGRVRDDVLTMTKRQQEPTYYGSLGGAAIALNQGTSSPVLAPSGAEATSELTQLRERLKLLELKLSEQPPNELRVDPDAGVGENKPPAVAALMNTDEERAGSLAADAGSAERATRATVPFEVTFGGEKDEGVSDARLLPDGGIVVVGKTASKGEGGSDGWVIKLDSEGRTVWQKTFGTVHDDALFNVEVLDDGRLVMVGGMGTDDRRGYAFWGGVLADDGTVLSSRSEKKGQHFENTATVRRDGRSVYMMVPLPRDTEPELSRDFITGWIEPDADNPRARGKDGELATMFDIVDGHLLTSGDDVLVVYDKKTGEQDGFARIENRVKRLNPDGKEVSDQLLSTGNDRRTSAVIDNGAGGIAFLANERFRAGQLDGVFLMSKMPDATTAFETPIAFAPDIEGRSLARLPDGRFVVAIHVGAGNIAPADGSLQYLSAQGQLMGSRVLGDRHFEVDPQRIIVRPDGGYTVVGTKKRRSNGEIDGWARTFPADAPSPVTSAFFGGSATDDKAAEKLASLDPDPLVERTPEQDQTVATLAFEITLGGSASETINDMRLLPDGGVIFVGETASKGAGKNDGWAVRLDASGAVVWDRAYGSEHDDAFYSVEALDDGTFVVFGGIGLDGKGGQAGGGQAWWGVRLSADGETILDERDNTDVGLASSRLLKSGGQSVLALMEFSEPDTKPRRYPIGRVTFDPADLTKPPDGDEIGFIEDMWLGNMVLNGDELLVFHDREMDKEGKYATFHNRVKRFSLDGKVLGVHLLSLGEERWMSSIIADGKGGFLISGSEKFEPSANGNAFLLAIDGGFKQRFEIVTGRAPSATGNALGLLPDGRIVATVIAGEATGHKRQGQVLFLSPADGKELGRIAIDTDSHEIDPYLMRMTADGGFIIAGNKIDRKTGGSDGWVRAFVPDDPQVMAAK